MTSGTRGDAGGTDDAQLEIRYSRDVKPDIRESRAGTVRVSYIEAETFPP